MGNTNMQELFDQSIDTSNLSPKQKSVLQASLTLFSEKGFSETKTTDIARVAGVAEGTVYKKFKTKQEILNAIMAPFITIVIPHIASDFLAKLNQYQFHNLADFLKYMVRDRLAFAVENKKQLRILLQEVSHNSALFNSLGAQLSAELKLNSNLFVQFQKTGELVDWPVQDIIRMIIGAMFGYIFPIAINQSDFDINLVTTKITTFLLNGLAP